MTMMPCVNKPLLRYSRAIFRPPGTCLRPGARPKAKRAWFTLEAREMVSGFPGIGHAFAMRSSERCKWQRHNSIGEPNHGFGDGLPKPDATCIVSFVTAF